MSEETDLPFPNVLDSLFAGDTVSIKLLYRLSDLSTSDRELFQSRWTGVPDERRHVIVRHLADISELNTLVDFVPLFNFCLSDPVASVRIAALDGFWDTTDNSLVAPIISILQHDENDEARAAAASALAHYVLMVEWGQLPEAVAPPIVAALLAEYDNPNVASSVKRAVLEALASANHPRIATLISEAYDTGELDMQISAVFAMGGSADSRWLPTVLEEMASSSAEMRVEAARAAGTIGDPEAIPELANLVLDEDLAVATEAVNALGQIGGDEAAGMLLRLADDPDFEALYEAVEEALDEIEWLGGDADFFPLYPDDELEED
jgi:HEAT repeat protein